MPRNAGLKLSTVGRDDTKFLSSLTLKLIIPFLSIALFLFSYGLAVVKKPEGVASALYENTLI